VSYYNRRDLFEHWVRRQQPANRPCTHACCRGYHPHPESWPTILPSRKLRGASDEQLAEHFQRVAYKDTPQSRRAEAQVLHEMERRDKAIEQARAHREAVIAGRAGRRMEREAEAHRIRTQAEEYTKGYLVSPEGRARGISDEEILAGRENVFIRYATPEAKAYFADNPRPTPAHFRGKDTRVPYSDRPTARRPVTYRTATRGRGRARRSLDYAVVTGGET
jgi:hypothetical protein